MIELQYLDDGGYEKGFVSGGGLMGLWSPLGFTHSFYLSVLQLFVTVVLVVCKGTGNLCILAVHYGAFQTVPDMKDTHTHTHATSTYGCIYDLI